MVERGRWRGKERGAESEMNAVLCGGFMAIRHGQLQVASAVKSLLS